MNKLRKQSKIVFFAAIAAISVVLLYAHLTAAATYTWDGGAGDGLWSSCDNWSSNVCPGSGDIATFDGTNTSDSVIDGAFAGTVAGIDINSGYTGTITQQRDIIVGTSNFAQDAGTFTQGTYGITVTNASMNINAGTFNAGIGTSTLTSSIFTVGSATFNSSSTRNYILNGCGNVSFTYPGVFPSQVFVDKDSNACSLTFAAGTSFSQPVDFTGNAGNLTVSSGASVTATSSDAAINFANLTISGTLNASSTIDLSVSFTLNSTGVFYYDSTDMYMSGSYTEVSGATFDKTGVTFTFDGGINSTLTYTGEFPSQVNLVKSGNFYVASGVSFTYPIDCTNHTGGLQVNSGSTVTATTTNSTLNFASLTISGTLNASTTVDISTVFGFTLNSTGVFNYDASAMYNAGSYTEVSGATFDKTGITFTFDGGSGATFTYPGTFPEQVYVTKGGSTFTVAGGTSFALPVDFTGNSGGLQINSGATIVATTTDPTIQLQSLTVSGNFYSSTTLDVNSGFGNVTLNSGAVFAFQGDSLYIEVSYTDNGASIPYSTAAIVFDGFTTDSTVTCTGDLPFSSLDVNKSHPFGDFTLAAGCKATSTTITTTGSGPLTINGTLATDGNTLTGSSLIVGSTGVLRLYGNETVTAPSLSAGSLVDYYGPSTYTSLSGGSSYANIQFSAGTYNLAGSLTVSEDFTNSGATFNQTSGTVTLTGTSNTVSGNNTFANLTKSIGAAATLTFGAGNTQTVTGTLTLEGLNAGNRLTLQSSSPSSQWFIDPQSTRTLNYLAISDGNNANATAVNCYDVDCTDGGNNTNFDFTAPAPPEPIYRLNGGTRLKGGVRL